MGLWTATSDSRDFRKARWTQTAAPAYAGGEVALAVPATSEKFTATFGEVVFDFEGLPFHDSTQIRILEPKK